MKFFTRMREKWRKMETREKAKIQILIYAFIIAGYSIIYLLFTHTPYFEAKKMLHRRLDRIEKRTDTGDIKVSSINPKTVSRRIAEIDKEIAELMSSMNELDAGFAPVDSAEIQQQLMLEISSLAERVGVELLSVSRKGFRADEEVFFVPLDRELGRPLLIITVNTEFGPLMEFLHGFKKLSFHIAVMNLKIYSRHMDDREHGGNTHLPPGAMFARLEVSI